MHKASSWSKKKTRGIHAPPIWEEEAIKKEYKLVLEGNKIIDYCLFYSTVDGAWIDQKAQKLLGPLK